MAPDGMRTVSIWTVWAETLASELQPAPAVCAVAAELQPAPAVFTPAVEALEPQAPAEAVFAAAVSVVAFEAQPSAEAVWAAAVEAQASAEAV
jgi:hypothetical protein